MKEQQNNKRNNRLITYKGKTQTIALWSEELGIPFSTIKNRLNKDCNIPIKTDGKIRYTVPQKITEKKDISVYFRVGNIYRNSKILVRDGERVVFSKKKEKLAPGEMECIKLTAEQIGDAKELYFSVENA